MKKILGVILGIIFSLGIAKASLAADFNTTVQVGGQMWVGYLALPDYKVDELTDITNHYDAYRDGAFFGDLDLSVGLLNNMRIRDGLTAQLVSQMQVFKDDTSTALTSYADPIRNFNLTYNPGPVKLMFDAKGQEVVMGSVRYEELLVLNVARLYAKDGGTRLYLDSDQWAKQLTVQIPFKKGRAVAVFSLEPTKDGKPGDFLGGFGEMNIRGGKVGLGYHAQNSDDNYKHKVLSDYYVLAFDYKLTSDVRLQVDYSTKDGNGTGYIANWKAIDIIEDYPDSPFKIKQDLKTRLTMGNYLIKLRLLNTNNDPAQNKTSWNKDMAYWVDFGYTFKPYTVGVNYRNWTFADEDPQNKQVKADVTEFYVKHDLTSSSRDYLKAFFRTDKSYGVCMVISFW
jgi:hypothetical protein